MPFRLLTDRQTRTDECCRLHNLLGGDNKWLIYQSGLLGVNQVATKSRLAAIAGKSITDKSEMYKTPVNNVCVLDWLADKKTEVAFQCLVHMLPEPPQRAVKKPRLTPEAVFDNFFQDFEVSSNFF